LTRIIGRGNSLGDALEKVSMPMRDPRDAALARELCQGTARWYPRIEALSRALLRTPLRHKDLDIHALLCIGLYQLIYLRIPPHASIHATVQAARELGKPWAVRLLNGVLRSFQRRSETLLEGVDRSPSARLAHPEWLLQALRDAWPTRWQAVVAANNARAPMSLRVNRRRIERGEYLRTLQAHGIDAEGPSWAEDGILLKRPVGIEGLPGFAEGLVSVQDCAAQLAAGLLDPQPGDRVLDACAAPGGKTGHLLEIQPEIRQLWAMDSDEARLERLRDNLHRLRLEARVICADAAEPATWWDGTPFERILLDAPCSGTGVIRRHPDIKLLRRATDIPALAARQDRMLQALWPLLAPHGTLLYATCSVLSEENEMRIAKFLASHDDAAPHLPEVEGVVAGKVGVQILPGSLGRDGFYYSRLYKRA
jgi:16S rRNA (cytosine967-C5)-methyltransferase